ncbi:MAG: carbohydrate ABC transporter permease [Clostridia bacterium]|nr:carbohydrate ABC transporter permease [Clostridia bacterium]
MDTTKRRRSRKTGREKVPFIGWFLFAYLLIHCVAIILYFSWGFGASVKTNYEFMKDMVGYPEGLPWDWAWENYKKAFELFNMKVLRDGILTKVTVVEMIGNQLLYAFLSIFMSRLANWPVMYVSVVFWKKFKLARFIYTFLYVMMFIPTYGAMASAFLLYKKLGMYDSWWYVIFAYFSFGDGFILTHAYLSGLSSEMSEAAKIDGANNLDIMLRIYLPLSMPLIGLQVLTAFLSRWNDYETMLYWLPSYPGISYGVYKFTTSTATGASWPTIQLAGGMMLLVPVLAIFAVFSKKIIGGVTVSVSK